MKHYKSVDFFSNFRMSSRLYRCKSPYWRLAGDGSGPTLMFVLQKKVWKRNY